MTHRRDKNKTWVALFQELELAVSDYERHLDEVAVNKKDDRWNKKKDLLDQLRKQVLSTDPSIGELKAIASQDSMQAEQLAYAKKDVLLNFFQGHEQQINDLKKRRGHRAESKFWQVIDYILDKLGLLRRVVHGATLSNKLHLFSKKIKTLQQADLKTLKEKATKVSSADELIELLQQVPTWPERRRVAVSTIFDVVRPQLVELARQGVSSGSPSAAQHFGRILHALTLGELQGELQDPVDHFKSNPDMQRAFQEIVQSPKNFSDLMVVFRGGSENDDKKKVIFQLIVKNQPQDWIRLITAPGASADHFMTALYYATPAQRAMIVKAVLQDAPDTLFELAKASAIHHEQAHQILDGQPGDQLMKTHQSAYWFGLALAALTPEELQTYTTQVKDLFKKRLQPQDVDSFIDGLRHTPHGAGRSSADVEKILEGAFSPARPSSSP